jgi:hypothetical protein
MVKFGLKRPKAGFNIAEAFAKGQLSKAHAEELIETGEGSNAMVATVALDALLEWIGREPGHDLGEDSVADMHEGLPPEQDS